MWPSRTRNEFRHLLGDDFNGFVVCDCYSAYTHLADDCREFCWAHLLRDFQAMIDRGGVAAEIGTRLKESGQELTHHWNRLKSKSIQRATVDHYYRKLRGEILDALHDGALCGEPKTAETCRRPGNERYSQFVFVHHERVSPTNKAIEQALRKLVISRRLTFGTEEKTSSQNLAVIMSVTETCRRVGRRPFDNIMEAVKAAFNTKPAAKLTPQN